MFGTKEETLGYNMQLGSGTYDLFPSNQYSINRLKHLLQRKLLLLPILSQKLQQKL